MSDLRTLALAARDASDFVHPDHWDTFFVFQNAASPEVVLALLDDRDALYRAIAGLMELDLRTDGSRQWHARDCGWSAHDNDEFCSPSCRQAQAALTRYEEASRE